MAIIHFLNVLEGDCNIIEHDSGRLTMIDVSNAYNDIDTEEEKKVQASKEREERRLRTQVPTGRVNYKQKEKPDNPILYLRKLIKPSEIFRFIITHPDMDHIDGIKDLYDEYFVRNTWDTDNKKELDLENFGGGYNKDDWKFYKELRDGKFTKTTRLTYFDDNDCLYWNQDNIKILAPSRKLLKEAIESGDYNDSSYVILFTPPKKNGGKWKILFGGDTHDVAWNHIIEEYSKEVENIDVLFAPHHGRDSKRDYSFLDILKPRVTLFGNASSEHLAYDKYPKLKITNNQAGYVVLNVTETEITFYVNNLEFAKDYKAKREWTAPIKNTKFDAWGIFKIEAE
jgi:competence protein ComEC